VRARAAGLLGPRAAKKKGRKKQKRARGAAARRAPRRAPAPTLAPPARRARAAPPPARRMAPPRGGPKSSLALFRDCLRLVGHMAGRSSPKAAALRAIVAAQFRAHARETDPARIHVLKQG